MAGRVSSRGCSSRSAHARSPACCRGAGRSSGRRARTRSSSRAASRKCSTRSGTPISIDEACDDIRRRHERGKDFSIVVVSEGYELEGAQEGGEVDQFGHVRLSERGVGAALAQEIERRTGYETRVTVLGHVQRGGTP